jgi:hypothetical protein
MPTLYKLSPSYFRYLWSDCKHCYYLQVKMSCPTPQTPFPAIFTRMNKLLQDSVMGKNLQEINHILPSGLISTQEGYLKSKPVIGAEDCYISGRYDILIPLDDGTQAVVDFKITNPDEEQVKKYSSQLHAYKYALENPLDGREPTKVSKLGLITVTPESIEHIDGNFVFTAVPKWHPIEEDMDSFLKLIKDISNVLNGELPPPSENCSYCKYRKQFEKEEAPAVPF